MKNLFIILLSMMCFSNTYSQSDDSIIQKIYREQLTKSPVYENLRFLSKEIGNRVNGSHQLETAIEYTRQLMIKYQFDTVYLQPIKIPNWIREPNETVRVINSPSVKRDLNCIALGNSIGTGEEGLIGEVIEINGLDDLTKTDKDLITGKIVFLNQHFEKGNINILESYAKVLWQRANGASQASAKGAIAVIIRSLTPVNNNSPVTGGINYQEGIKKIPAVAISTNDADLLSAQIKQTPETKIYIEIHCKTLKDVTSYNVIGEIKGSQFPDEIILTGGHIDTWDIGEGAHDDGAGCLQAIEVLRLFRALNIEPKHTLRAVMWVNEENGVSGGAAYAEESILKNTKHIAAIESDLGGFLPLGFYYDTNNEAAINRLMSWKKLFEPYQLLQFDKGLPVFDILPLKNEKNLLLGLMTNMQKYSGLYHSENDVFETVDKRELELGAAAMASIVFLIDKYGIE